MNLSGKSTRIGRTSGECWHTSATKEEKPYWLKLSGNPDRDPLQGVSVFFCA